MARPSVGTLIPVGAVGTAEAGDVLTGKTFSSEPAGVGAEGSMPNRGAHNITPGTSSIAIPAGYHNGSGYVASLGGNATAGDVLSGKTFSSDSAGRNQSGSMPNQGAMVITPGTSSIAIPAGYHNGMGRVNGDVNLVPGNIRKGVSIFGVVGTVTSVQGMPLWSLPGNEHVDWEQRAVNDPANRLRWTKGDSLRIDTAWGSYTNVQGSWVTTNPIDVGPFSRLVVIWETWAMTDRSGDENQFAIIVSNNKTGDIDNFNRRVYYDRTGYGSRTSPYIEVHKDIIDVSTLTGNRYVRMHIRSSAEDYRAGGECYLWYAIFE